MGFMAQECDMGLEPTNSPWKGEMLPLHQSHIRCREREDSSSQRTANRRSFNREHGKGVFSYAVESRKHKEIQIPCETAKWDSFCNSGC